MTVKEMMLKLQKDNIDIDFYDNYDERAFVAYCGTVWTEKAEQKYKKAFDLPVELCKMPDPTHYGIIIVNCDTAEEAQALYNLLYSMAGYLETPEEYEELYPDKLNGFDA